MIPYTITLLYDNMHLLKILHTVTLTKSLCTLVYEIYYYFTYHPKSAFNILMSKVQIIMDVYL